MDGDNHVRCVCWWCWKPVWADEHDFAACHVEFMRPQQEAHQRRAAAKAARETARRELVRTQPSLDLGFSDG